MNHYYDVFPKTVLANAESEIRVRGRFGHSSFKDTEIVSISYYPFSGERCDGTHRRSMTAADALLPAENWHLENDGTLVIKMKFAGEQEHLFTVQYKAVYSDLINYDFPREKTMAFRVYSLEADLYCLQPFRGDFHIHSMRSDGQQSPAYVAARYRREGFDFAAISDHEQYAPSQEAIDSFAELPLSFKLYNGEEVHSKNNIVHIINFGSTKSVNEMWQKDTDTYLKEVESYLEKIPQEERVSGLNYFPVAASEWVFDKIRENGGLAVYCHPYWYTNANMLPEALSDVMFERRRFDAFELIGGFPTAENRSISYQVTKWMEETAAGNRFPVVGLSDSHGTDSFGHGNSRRVESYNKLGGGELFNWYYTIIFAEKNEVSDLIDGVKKFRSVAVAAQDGGRPDIYGDLRLVKYASFLENEFFPLLQNYCETEGNLMLDYLAGEDRQQITDALKLLRHRCGEFRKKCFPGCTAVQ